MWVLLCSCDIWNKNWMMVSPRTVLEMSNSLQLCFSLIIIHCTDSKGKLSWFWLNKLKKKNKATSISINKMYKSIAITSFNWSPFFLTVPGWFSGLGHTETNKMHWSNEWKSPFCSRLQDENTRRSIYKYQPGSPGRWLEAWRIQLKGGL